MDSIIVRNVKELEQYHGRLKDAKKDLEDLLAKLNTDCSDQGRNWEDGQYRAFEEKLTEFTNCVNDLLKEEWEEAMDVITKVLNRLK